MPRFRACLLAVLLLGGCSDLAVPQRGFATRFYHSSVEPGLDPPPAFGAPLRGSDGKPLAPDSCEAAARIRAQDIAAQDFSEEIQQKVFNRALQDCRTWRARLGKTG